MCSAFTSEVLWTHVSLHLGMMRVQYSQSKFYIVENQRLVNHS